MRQTSLTEVAAVTAPVADLQHHHVLSVFRAGWKDVSLAKVFTSWYIKRLYVNLPVGTINHPLYEAAALQSKYAKIVAYMKAFLPRSKEYKISAMPASSAEAAYSAWLRNVESMAAEAEDLIVKYKTATMEATRRAEHYPERQRARQTTCSAKSAFDFLQKQKKTNALPVYVTTPFRVVDDATPQGPFKYSIISNWL